MLPTRTRLPPVWASGDAALTRSQLICTRHSGKCSCMHINTTITSRTRSNTSRSRNPYHTAVQAPDGLDSQNLNNAQLRTLVATILQPTLSPPFRAHLETGELDDVIDDIMSLCEVAAVAAHDGCEFPDDVVNESKAMAAVADHLASLVLARPFNLAYRKALRVAGAGKENSAPPAMVSSRRSAKNVSLVGLARDSSARSDRSATTAVAATAAAAAVTGSLAPPSCTLRGLPHIVKPRIKRDRPRDIDLDETSYYTCLEKFRPTPRFTHSSPTSSTRTFTPLATTPSSKTA
ncbi:uncharacterized protein AMSG_11031 [Thecamonas trahens ATCC 50062]|uniref:Uncharacterized protein n=1 Tax=Thecamonas trahens ATCC 50062 TaxID=461836 RepID=A0A0L0DSX8_THETB|nr:hypothetical protein AMSG_11031 [Thecamonas trahens ATCC 50062]KNC55375.1 hypothetical protein AMSG_11031 [Thecamonas trahens ATCC 50062]|eukprot:XP_013753009.1 hypothetical protein AMSG_11031 [Thecamonas trahens ATCC 50062]